MSSTSNLGKSSYASFYLAPLTFGYLSFEENNPLLQYIETIRVNLLIEGLEVVHIFWVFTAFTFLGAMQVHGVSRAIYGPAGPAERPKHKVVQIRHSLAFVLQTDVDNIPVIPCHLVYIGFTGILKEFLRNRSLLEAGYQQLIELRKLVTWSTVPSILYFVPLSAHKLMTKAAFLSLGFALYLRSGGYPAFVLFAALFLFLFRKTVWAPLPDVFNTEALEERFTPEYELHNPERACTSQARIQSENSDRESGPN